MVDFLDVTTEKSELRFIKKIPLPRKPIQLTPVVTV